MGGRGAISVVKSPLPNALTKPVHLPIHLWYSFGVYTLSVSHLSSIFLNCIYWNVLFSIDKKKRGPSYIFVCDQAPGSRLWRIWGWGHGGIVYFNHLVPVGSTLSLTCGGRSAHVYNICLLRSSSPAGGGTPHTGGTVRHGVRAVTSPSQTTPLREGRHDVSQAEARSRPSRPSGGPCPPGGNIL